MKTLVIFDLDGTLLNTIEDLGNATNHALQSLGFPVHRIDSYNRMVGNGVTKLLERALPEDARSIRVIEAMRSRFTEYYDQHLSDFTTIYPGVKDLLDELAGRGINIAVASNKYQSAVTKLVDTYFGDLKWASVAGHREGVPTKPDPSVVFGILNDCPTPKANVLYVGDSGIDMETASRACVESVGVTWGFRPRQDLVDHYANHIVSNPDDILSYLV
jgi:phosphoglycolate phosphatase